MFSWGIANLDRNTEDGCVTTIHWTARLVEEEDGEQFSASAYGSIGLEPPVSLIPYEDLTEEIVTGWLEEKMGEEAIESMRASLIAQIAEQKVPSRAFGLPWS